MIEKLYKALSPLKLKGKNITVALSGGKDSMSLLYGLLEIKDSLGINVSAAHFNHLLRGEEALRDENFVKDVCKSLGIELVVERGNVNAYAAQNKMGTEQAAREMRYDFFYRVNKDYIATAHTSSDNFETLLLHILRGSGLDGLCGIPLKRDIFIRPMLNISSDEVLCYCKKKNIKFVNDSTNFTDLCYRNFLRNNIIPLLKQINPSLEDSSCRLINSLNEDKDLIDSIADKKYSEIKCENGIKASGLENLNESLYSRIIIRFLKDNFFEVSAKRVTDLKNAIKENKNIVLDDNRTVGIKDGFLCEIKNEKNNIKFYTEIIKKDSKYLYKDGKINNLLLKNAIDCDKIEGILKVRTRQSGDVISFSHRKVSKSLKKLFSEDGVDKALREILPVIADDKGVVWVYSYGIDKRVCPDKNTKNVYTVKCEKR